MVFPGPICCVTVHAQPTCCGRHRGNGRQGAGMDWILIGALVIIWTAYFFPTRDRRGRARSSVDQFERDMGLLEQTEKATGRWIVAPRKGEPFVGRQERALARARALRRKTLLSLLEALPLPPLSGISPPLNGRWIAPPGLFLF